MADKPADSGAQKPTVQSEEHPAAQSEQHPAGPQGPANSSGPQGPANSSGPPGSRGQAGPSGKQAGSGADLARAALAAARARAEQDGLRRTGRTGSRMGRGTETGAGARRLKRRRWSGPGEDRARDPQLVGDTLRGWLKSSGNAEDLLKANLFTRWDEIVGASVAVHAQPVSLVDGELTVQAESTAWATQLRLLSRGLIKRINDELGTVVVRRIKTAGPAAPSWRFGNRHVSGRGPRDTYG